VNPLGDSIDTIRKNTGTLTDTSKELGLEINRGISLYVAIS
jgi:hypothetical protein